LTSPTSPDVATAFTRNTALQVCRPTAPISVLPEAEHDLCRWHLTSVFLARSGAKEQGLGIVS